MHIIEKIARNRVVLGFFAVLALGIFVAPNYVSAGSSTDFGVNVFQSSLQLGNQDLRVTMAKIINVALSLLGIVAVVIILIGGFKWMTAGGEQEKVEEAKKLIYAGIIGMAIILAAFAIARFTLSSLSTATSTGNLSLN